MSDPTYNKTEIEANPVWHLAWVLSEIRNDSAPLGWGSYISTAECLLATFDVTRKGAAPKKDDGKSITRIGRDSLTEKAFVVYLRDGSKITIGRDKRTKGPAWLEVKPQEKIKIT